MKLVRLLIRYEFEEGKLELNRAERNRIGEERRVESRTLQYRIEPSSRGQ